ncbi:hypothetical protein TRFO_20499 [Tritrichomonas foetus]|uniref:Uncharacterized protein n=1 Tax=Tritrichomonas foetus TaxID=1144522 RepID=A0A1J4KK39_9EUKA|nr:hypothetical protein TRFO_20499 [Tritrichomonas foetus]|eukprot:OHT10212.1 hypothetical protein TRFO_20499 [Tritrichomonas foetus]
MNGITPLHIAAECGFAPILNYLIAFTEIDVNHADGKPNDPIFRLNLPKGKVMPRQQIELIEKEKKRYLLAQKVLFFY